MRPRERYGHRGPSEFGDAELLALVLGTGTAHRTAEEIAGGLLRRFGGLTGVARAHPGQLETVQGVGPARAVRVHAALAAGRRSLRRPDELPARIDDPAAAAAHLAPALRGLADEELHALLLDRRHQVLAHRVLTRGSDAYTIVEPRQVFREALAAGAAAVILGHNHPSGDPTPSAQDRDVTQRVARAGRIVGVALVDHVVIGGESWRSMAEEGLFRPGQELAGWTA